MPAKGDGAPIPMRTLYSPEKAGIRLNQVRSGLSAKTDYSLALSLAGNPVGTRNFADYRS